MTVREAIVAAWAAVGAGWRAIGRGLLDTQLSTIGKVIGFGALACLTIAAVTVIASYNSVQEYQWRVAEARAFGHEWRSAWHKTDAYATCVTEAEASDWRFREGNVERCSHGPYGWVPDEWKSAPPDDPRSRYWENEQRFNLSSDFVRWLAEKLPPSQETSETIENISRIADK